MPLRHSCKTHTLAHNLHSPIGHSCPARRSLGRSRRFALYRDPVATLRRPAVQRLSYSLCSHATLRRPALYVVAALPIPPPTLGARREANVCCERPLPSVAAVPLSFPSLPVLSLVCLYGPSRPSPWARGLTPMWCERPHAPLVLGKVRFDLHATDAAWQSKHSSSALPLGRGSCRNAAEGVAFLR